jgi:uncharacterized phage protein (TIGR02218 family)
MSASTIYPPALAAHLEGEATSVCHCWRLTRRDGTVKGFTDHDGRLAVDGTLFQPLSGFTATEARDTLGLAVDTVDVEGALSSDDIAEDDIATGLYDDARVETLLVNWAEPSQFARLRRATIGKITRRDHAFVAELKSETHQLDQIKGRVTARKCDAVLGDQRCRFALAQEGFSATGVVAAMSAPDALSVSGLGGFASGWFSAGTLQWTSGALLGRTSFVTAHLKSSAGVSLTLQRDADRIANPGHSAAPGDTFDIRAGCDKSFATCKAKFGNALNFQGFPHLPGSDAAYSYAADGDVFDGGALVA